MKKHKWFALFLSIVFMFNIISSGVYAADFNQPTDGYLGDIATNNQYAVYNFEDEEIRFIILIDRELEIGQFAITYLDDTDYSYELCFSLSDIPVTVEDLSWGDIQTFCFDSQNQWEEIYLPEAITITEEPTAAQNSVTPYSNSDAVAYFEDWLTTIYGNEYDGILVLSTTYNNLNMYIKRGFQTIIGVSREYSANETMTVASFILNFLGVSTASRIINWLSAIVGVGSIFTGDKIYEYSVKANWFRYVTLTLADNYPYYGLVHKYTDYQGYRFTNRNGEHYWVDEDTESTYYNPSESVFNDNDEILARAYQDWVIYG